MKRLVLLLLVACADPRGDSAPCTDCTSRIHPAGILDPASADFHVRELERRNWDFALCAGCHGRDFAGGTAQVSCLGCHAAGPTACVTCHGAAGPTTNAHLAHAQGSVACAACHVVPASWDADGHLVHAGVAITRPAPVVFGALAGLGFAGRAGPPSWDGATCSNVYCHGGGLPGGAQPTPRWDAPVDGGCTSCHGAPPPTPSHAGGRPCSACHPAAAPHADGVVQVGVGCTDCHGSAGSPAPPRDLSGNTFTTALGVGAHQAHLLGAARLAAPIACETCHVVPTAGDPLAHVGAPPPAQVTLGLGWDRDAQTCATSYCHGAARPRWTSSGEVSCGSCHGVPPAGLPHTPDMALSSCASCHPGTVDASGKIIIVNLISEHLNGHVDLQ